MALYAARGLGFKAGPSEQLCQGLHPWAQAAGRLADHQALAKMVLYQAGLAHRTTGMHHRAQHLG
jgi:hypothetical protein